MISSQRFKRLLRLFLLLFFGTILLLLTLVWLDTFLPMFIQGADPGTHIPPIRSMW